LSSLVLSIPHSGTRVLTKWLGCEHFHVYGRIHPDFAGFDENVLLVSSLRDPRAIWRSWVKRVNLDRGAVALEYFEPQFEYLESFDKEYDILYIPVDLLGLGKVGHVEGSTETDHPEPDWNYIYNLPFVKRFYVA